MSTGERAPCPPPFTVLAAFSSALTRFAPGAYTWLRVDGLLTVICNSRLAGDDSPRMGVIRKTLSVWTAGLIDFRSDKERIARSARKTDKGIREQNRLLAEQNRLQKRRGGS